MRRRQRPAVSDFRAPFALIVGQKERARVVGQARAVIEVTNGVDILVERSMYWDANGYLFSGGTNGVGILVPR